MDQRDMLRSYRGVWIKNKKRHTEEFRLKSVNGVGRECFWHVGTATQEKTVREVDCMKIPSKT